MVWCGLCGVMGSLLHCYRLYSLLPLPLLGSRWVLKGPFFQPSTHHLHDGKVAEAPSYTTCIGISVALRLTLVMWWISCSFPIKENHKEIRSLNLCKVITPWWSGILEMVRPLPQANVRSQME